MILTKITATTTAVILLCIILSLFKAVFADELMSRFFWQRMLVFCCSLAGLFGMALICYYTFGEFED